MVFLAVVVFFALQRITPGYGIVYDRKWGPSVNNRLGWVLMEAPVFFAMLIMWLCSPKRGEPALVVMTSLFLLHYFQRSFIFPMLIKGKSRMPLSIILSGVTFNLLNAYMIGGWFFYLDPAPETYGASWLTSPLFILGCAVFFTGMGINLHSDHIIRSLRRMDRLRHTHMVAAGTGVRALDIRQPRPPRPRHPPQIYREIRRRLLLAPPPLHNPLHLLTHTGDARRAPHNTDDIMLFTPGRIGPI